MIIEWNAGGTTQGRATLGSPVGATPQTPAEVGALINSIPGGNILLTYVKGQVKDAAVDAIKPYMLATVGISVFALVLSIIALAKS